MSVPGPRPAADAGPDGDANPVGDAGPQAEAEPTPTPPRRGPLRRIAEIAVVVAFVGFVAWAVIRQWDDVRRVLGELSPMALGVAGITMFAGIWCSFCCWREILRDLGSSVPLTGAMRIFFVGQAGKYLPGKVWPILTQARLGRAYGVPRRASGAAALIFMVLVLGTGLVVAVCTLPALGSGTGALRRYWWVLLLLPVALACLWPGVLNRLLALALRIARRPPMPRPVTLAGVSRAALWAGAMWAAYGVHLWALLADLGADSPYLLLRAVCAFAGSWSIGFLMLVAPAGVGPREVALVVLLQSTVAQPVALVASMVSRLLMTLGDVLWPVVALIAERARQRNGRG